MADQSLSLHEGDWPKGSAPPSGYVDWHDWAKAQHRHGLRQRQCKTCGLWIFPQEKCKCPSK